MLSFGHRDRIYLATEPVDFRKGHYGLIGVVKNALGGDPLRSVWVFHNRRRTDLKVLWWSQGGFVVAHKKLARGRFRLPEVTENPVRMTAAELSALLEGIDLSRCRRLPRWNPPET